MPNAAAAFKQIDVTRAAKGVQAAGLPVQSVVIDADGRIVVKVAGDQGTARPNPDDLL